MARGKKAVKTSISSSVPEKKARKKRIGNVRNLILRALKDGSHSRPALQKATGASYNGLVMHLSKLKDEKLVTFDSSNRIVTLSGRGSSITKLAKTSEQEATTAASSSPSASPTSTPLVAITTQQTPAGYSISHLKDALEQFSDRIKPVGSLNEKLFVLDQLGSQLGGPIAEVLAGIKADLLRA